MYFKIRAKEILTVTLGFRLKKNSGMKFVSEILLPFIKVKKCLQIYASFIVQLIKHFLTLLTSMEKQACSSASFFKMVSIVMASIIFKDKLVAKNQRILWTVGMV
jgi:hypothetical protein